MAYQTGAATNGSTLLSALATFATANGWTSNRNVTGTGTREVSLSKGTSFINLMSLDGAPFPTNNGIANANTAPVYGVYIIGSDGYSAAATITTQPGAGPGFYLPFNLSHGPFPSHHFIATAESIYVELEVAAGVFNRIGWGKLDLFNPAALGEGRYYYGARALLADNQANTTYIPLYKSGAVRVKYAAADGWANATGGSDLRRDVNAGWAKTQGNLISFVRDTTSPTNGIALLWPMIISISESASGTGYTYPIGSLPGIRFFNMTNYKALDTFSIAPDTWKVFPAYQQGVNNGVASANSDDRQDGLAYKIN